MIAHPKEQITRIRLADRLLSAADYVVGDGAIYWLPVARWGLILVSVAQYSLGYSGVMAALWLIACEIVIFRLHLVATLKRAAAGE